MFGELSSYHRRRRRRARAQKLSPCLWLINYYRQSFHISHVYSLWQDRSIGTIIIDLVTLTLKFDLLLQNFNLNHSFLTRRGRDFILHMCISYDKTFPWVHCFTLWPWPWSLTYCKKNFNLGHSLLTRRDRDFILHMYISCNKTFPMGTKFFYFVTLTLKFDLLLKNFNLGHSFLTIRVGLLYFTCAFLEARPLMPYHFWPNDLDLEGWTYFLKKLSWTMTFESEGLLNVALDIWLSPASYVVFLTTLVLLFDERVLTHLSSMLRWPIVRACRPSIVRALSVLVARCP